MIFLYKLLNFFIIFLFEHFYYTEKLSCPPTLRKLVLPLKMLHMLLIVGRPKIVAMMLSTHSHAYNHHGFQKPPWIRSNTSHSNDNKFEKEFAQYENCWAPICCLDPTSKCDSTKYMNIIKAENSYI
jgi:hypothetical protein